jgi:hypothetical protein
MYLKKKQKTAKKPIQIGSSLYIKQASKVKKYLLSNDKKSNNE